MKLTLHAFLTLDGVIQAPGGPGEDESGGFQHGGWQARYGDDEGGALIVGWFEHADAFLLGRRTYEIFSGYWPSITDPDNAVARRLNAQPKYVASTTLDAVEWRNSTLLGSDVAEDIAALKQQPGDELQLWGSADLARTLMEHDLIDEYRLLTYPIHLGTGKRLFTEGVKSAALRLLDATTTRTGVVIARYEPAGPVEHGTVL
ncbi:MAG TPA: dihydrofolate reductase family protein [Candidatus Dormibacteraeota bacterium]|nr:dihydrofolate reductase family protein [Candidatus Dormibacteraeota bacterium]